MNATAWAIVTAGTSAPAFFTTLHCALTLLRRYRPRGGPLILLPSLLFIAFPWVLPTPVWLAAGLAAHLVWFTATDLLLPDGAPAPPPAAPPRTLPAQRAAPATAPPPPARRRSLEVPVLAVVEETPEIRTFRLGRPPGMSFRPGQFLVVQVTPAGKQVARCYSIHSSPSAQGYLEISVRRQGLVSRYLHENIHAGSRLSVSGPGGAFVYPEEPGQLVLIAGGIGITPLMGMLRHALENDPSRPVVLLLSAKTKAQTPFLDELRVLERRHPLFRLGIALTAGDVEAGFHAGRIEAPMVSMYVADPATATYMICGPLPMIDHVRGLLASLGVPSDRVHFEKFETAVAEAAAIPARAAGGGRKIELRQRGRTVDGAATSSILESAEAAGESLPSMCRVGVCGTCRIRLVEGEVEGDFDALDASDQTAGFILACVARPMTDCVVDA